MLIPIWAKPLAIAAAVAVALSFTYFKGKSVQSDEHKLEKQAELIDKQKKELANYAKLLEVVEQQAGQERKSAAERESANAAVNTKLASTIEWLRNRPDRPAPGAVPSTTSSGQPGATGAELYRPDAEFLAREASRADRLRAALQQCYADVDAAQASWLALQQPKN